MNLDISKNYILSYASFHRYRSNIDFFRTFNSLSRVYTL